MLVDFSVQNFRSFREMQTFSMVASTEYGNPEERNVVHTGVPAVPHVLREACILGPNGAGKSTLIQAMGFMARFVHDSFSKRGGGKFIAEPFKFHSEWRNEPSKFEITVIHGGTLYRYGFSIARERVKGEWLFAQPKKTSDERMYFTRTFDEDTKEYDCQFNIYSKNHQDILKLLAGEEALLLSASAYLGTKHDFEFDIIKGVHEWLTRYLWVFPESWNAPQPAKPTFAHCMEETLKKRVINIMKRGEIHLHDIVVEEKNMRDTSRYNNLPQEVKDVLQREMADYDGVDVKFVRRDNQNSDIPLDLMEESTGTQNLFRMAGPIISGLEMGSTILFDELLSDIHTISAYNVIDMFYDNEINMNNAQLIITTHDTSITRHRSFNNDQIWMLEKDNEFSSSLIPYSDFIRRGNRSFQKNYLEGRLGAVPSYWGDDE